MRTSRRLCHPGVHQHFPNDQALSHTIKKDRQVCYKFLRTFLPSPYCNIIHPLTSSSPPHQIAKIYPPPPWPYTAHCPKAGPHYLCRLNPAPQNTSNSNVPKSKNPFPVNFSLKIMLRLYKEKGKRCLSLMRAVVPLNRADHRWCHLCARTGRILFPNCVLLFQPR